VGVQQRIALPGRPVVESDRQQPATRDVLDAGVAAAGADVLVQVGDRLGHPRMVRVEDSPAGRRVAQPVEDGHALGGAQDDVERRHRVPTMRPAEEFAGVGVAALEHPPEPRHRCFALQAQRRRGRAVPAAR
jgi:hypothetical protein